MEISPVLKAWAKHLHEEVIYDHPDPKEGLCPHCLETARDLLAIQQDIIAQTRLEDTKDVLELLTFSRERMFDA